MSLPFFKSSDIDLMNGEEFSASRPLKSASALIPIVELDDSANVIFARRTATARHHAGQISFPGGRKEDHDRGPAATALREAQEEIGLDPRNVEILGQCLVHETATGFLITPVVGCVASDFAQVLQIEEVAEVFEVPLNHLADLSSYRIESREWRSAKRYFYVIDYGSYRKWGATARILFGLAERLKS